MRNLIERTCQAPRVGRAQMVAGCVPGGDWSPKRKSGSQSPSLEPAWQGSAQGRCGALAVFSREDTLGFVLRKEQLGDILVNNGEGMVEDRELPAARPGKR